MDPGRVSQARPSLDRSIAGETHCRGKRRSPGVRGIPDGGRQGQHRTTRAIRRNKDWISSGSRFAAAKKSCENRSDGSAY